MLPQMHAQQMRWNELTQRLVINLKERLFTSRRRGCAPTRCRRGRRRPRAAPVVALEGREEVPDHGVLPPRRVHPAPTTAEPELTDSPLPVPKAPRRRPTKAIDSSLAKYEQFQKRQMFTIFLELTLTLRQLPQEVTNIPEA